MDHLSMRLDIPRKTEPIYWWTRIFVSTKRLYWLNSYIELNKDGDETWFSFILISVISKIGWNSFSSKYYDSLTMIMIGWRWDMILIHIHKCYIEDNLGWKDIRFKAFYLISYQDQMIEENNKIESSNNESLVARNK